MMYKRLLLILFCCISSFGFAQTEFQDQSVAFNLCEKDQENLIAKPDSVNFRIYIETLTHSFNNSQLSLQEINKHIASAKSLLNYHPELITIEHSLFYLIAIVEYSKGNVNEFEKITHRIFTKLKSNNKMVDLVNAKLDVANYLSTFGNKGKAKNYFLESEEIFKIHPSLLKSTFGQLKYVENANNIGYLYAYLNELDSAAFYYSLCIERATKYNHPEWLGIASGNLGDVYLKKGLINESEKLLIIDYNYSVDNLIYTSAINAAFQLIDINNKQEDYSSSKEYLVKIDSLLKKVPLTETFFLSQSKIKVEAAKASIFTGVGQLDSAKYYYTKAISKLIQLNTESNHTKRKLLRSRYEMENKIYTIAELEKTSKQNYLIIISAFVLLICALLIVIVQIKFNKELKLKNDKIAKQAERLEELNAHKNKMFSVIAHDLRGPLANLHSLLDLENNQLINRDEFLNYKSDVNKSLKGLSSTLENLLVWANHSIISGLQANLKEVNTSTLMHNILDQTNPMCLAKNIILSYTEEVKLNVWADESLLYIVLRNLISNSIKFTPKGKNITINTQLVVGNAEMVRICITDEGIGIEENRLKDLFVSNPKKVTQKGTEGEVGTGLGLIICKDFMELMEGKIYATSKLYEGSTFTIELKRV